MLNSLSLLPLTVSELESGRSSCISALESQGLSPEEAVLHISSQFESWIETGARAAPIAEELRPVLGFASWAEKSPKPAHTAYLELVRKLETRYSGTRREAVVALSHLPLILLLGREFDSSPAKIANVIGSSAGRNPVPWRAVQAILTYFKIPCKLDETSVSDLLERDQIEATEELGDANIETLLEVLRGKASGFGLPAEFRSSLASLFSPENGRPFIPYLQALLYVTVIDHFYDHPPEFIYTFNPRGSVANLIFDAFPAGLAPGGNPILNNFKAVDRLTHGWAESREDTRSQAIALVTIILGLSSLSFAARQHLSASIRRGIFRFIEIETPPEIVIPETTQIREIEKFLKNVSSTQTGTRGIIEQRVSDFLAAMLHADATWRSRGLGDPVNASNSSSRKLGDCDFQNANDRSCHAVESHAGRLTDIYVDEHLRTLRLNLPKRMEEWSGISDVDDWTLDIMFLVHEDACSARSVSVPLNVTSELKVMTFAELSAQVMSTAAENVAEALTLFNRWVVAVLNSRNTPHRTKRKALLLLQGET